MKKLFLFFATALFMLSCSNEPESTNPTNQTNNLELTAREKQVETQFQVKDTDTGIILYGYFHSDEETPINWKAPEMFYDVQGRRPVEVGYWECGPGVYTNGVNTYSIKIAQCDQTNVYMAIDHFSQTVYCFTTVWGGRCNKPNTNW